MKSSGTLIAALVMCCLCDETFSQSPVDNTTLSQAGGISEASPSSTSAQLNYRVCNASNSDQQALFKIDIIGNGVSQVPEGSTITEATLRLKAQVGGDGLMYRAGEPWDSTPTWNEVGDVLTAGSSIGVGLNTEQSIEFDVTSHVQLWADGTSNQGWVIKGFLDDCQAARIYNGSAGLNDRPRLRVYFIPPDTTPPQVTDIDIGSTVSTHPDYDLPVGSGVQIKTVPIAKVNQVFVTFSENVTNVSASTVSLATKSGTSIPATVSYSSNVATLQLSTPITSATKVVLTVTSGSSGVRDPAGNQLDGEWSNPATVGTSSSDTFPSGNGVAGGQFVFRFTVLPGDYNVSNIVDTADWVLWRNNLSINSGALFTQGDGDGDGDVEDPDDESVWTANYGIDQTVW